MRRILGWFLRHLYRELAWAYDAVAWFVSFGRWTAWGETALAYRKEGPLLEVGCGTGRLLSRLAGDAPAVGSDASRAMLKRARRHAASVPLCQARAQALPFPPSTFDTVLSIFPSPYIYDPASWAEFRRVLRPGGRVVVVHAVQAGGALPYRLACGLLGRAAPGAELPAGGFRLAWHRVHFGKDRVLLCVAERDDGADPR